eukprot:TRINITY_DN8185_c0_g1_i1.p1 TRINITY_DN8185_c0_g1~~TRINITY_DN8185_c0_g1_i1.p1  ORF type:complete len:263 (+),score=44.43 TRINITY_DN8185_c0_g1_i1:1-789(+)
MEITIKTPDGKIKVYEVERLLSKPSSERLNNHHHHIKPKTDQVLVLEYDAQHSFQVLPLEIQRKIIDLLEPSVLIRLHTVSKIFEGLLNEETLWRKHLVNMFPSRVMWLNHFKGCKALFIQLYKSYVEVKGCWRRIFEIRRMDLQPGLSEKKLYDMEQILLFPLPDDVYNSFKMYNGNSVLNSMRTFDFFGLSLLSLEEILSTPTITTLDDGDQPLNLIPFTSVWGYKQFFFSEMGYIYMKSGFNIIKQADNFVEFINSLIT